MIFDKIMMKRLGKNLILFLCLFAMLFTVVPPSAKASWETTEDMGSYVRHYVWDNVWQNTSGYQSQWVSSGYNNCYTAYNDVWINYWENGVWSYVNYWENGYWSYVNYWDYGNGNWGGGYYQWIVTSWGGGYYQWIVTSSGGGYYDRQYYTTCNWVDTSHYESVWVPSGYYATQLINQYDVQKPAPVPTTAPTPSPTPVPVSAPPVCNPCGGGDQLDELKVLLQLNPDYYGPKLRNGEYDHLFSSQLKAEIRHISDLWNNLNEISNDVNRAMQDEAHTTANKLRDIGVWKKEYQVTRIRTFIPFDSMYPIPYVDAEKGFVVGTLEGFFDIRKNYDPDDTRIRTEQYILAWSDSSNFDSSMSALAFNYNGHSQGLFKQVGWVQFLSMYQ